MMKKLLITTFLLAFTFGSMAQLRWVPVSNCNVPSGAVAGGEEPGRELIICRANYQGGKHPGKVVGCGCNFGYGGKEIVVQNFEVLVGYAEIMWVDVIGQYGPLFDPGMPGTYNVNGINFTVPNANIPYANNIFYAFQGGWEANGRPLLICNANFYTAPENGNASRNLGIHPGKVVSNCCNFGYGGNEIRGCNEYKIMVVKGQGR